MRGKFWIYGNPTDNNIYPFLTKGFLVISVVVKMGILTIDVLKKAKYKTNRSILPSSVLIQLKIWRKTQNFARFFIKSPKFGSSNKQPNLLEYICVTTTNKCKFWAGFLTFYNQTPSFKNMYATSIQYCSFSHYWTSCITLISGGSFVL